MLKKYYKDEQHKTRINYGEVDSWYIKNDHQRIVSEKLWNKVQKNFEKKREYLATGSIVGENNEATYPYKNMLYCGICGHKLKRCVYSKQNRVEWICAASNEFRKGFCEGIRIPDSVVRSWGDITDNLYVTKEVDDLGKITFKRVKESTWKRNHKVKPRPHLPERTKENYPFLGMVFCKKCGSPLARRLKVEKVEWVCSGWYKHTSKYCSGIKIPNDILLKVGCPDHNIYIGKEVVNGEERYGYTEEPDKDKWKKN